MSERKLTEAQEDAVRQMAYAGSYSREKADRYVRTVEQILAEHTQALQAELTNAREIARLATESETGWRREAEELAVERNRLREGIEALADKLDAVPCICEECGDAGESRAVDAFRMLLDRLS